MREPINLVDSDLTHGSFPSPTHINTLAIAYNEISLFSCFFFFFVFFFPCINFFPIQIDPMHARN